MIESWDIQHIQLNYVIRQLRSWRESFVIAYYFILLGNNIWWNTCIWDAHAQRVGEVMVQVRTKEFRKQYFLANGCTSHLAANMFCDAANIPEMHMVLWNLKYMFSCLSWLTPHRCICYNQFVSEKTLGWPLILMVDCSLLMPVGMQQLSLVAQICSYATEKRKPIPIPVCGCLRISKLHLWRKLHGGYHVEMKYA